MALFEETGYLEERVTFPSGILRYVLERTSGPDLSADFLNGTLIVLVPDSLAHHWTSTPQVGMAGSYQSLDILVEKDFQCTHGPVDEDAFPGGDPAIAR